jgi:hypothetical protein
MSAKRGYVVAIRRNGALYGCMGPYTTRKAAETEAAALPVSRGSEVVVLGVRDNGFGEAWSRLSGAYREAGRATAEAGREAVKGVREAPGRAAAAARKRAQDVAAEARRRVETAAEKRREQAAIALAEQIEAMGYEVTLRRVRKNSHALVALEAAHMAGRAGKATAREASRAASDAGEALAEIVRATSKRINRRTKAR